VYLVLLLFFFFVMISPVRSLTHSLTRLLLLLLCNLHLSRFLWHRRRISLSLSLLPLSASTHPHTRDIKHNTKNKLCTCSPKMGHSASVTICNYNCKMQTRHSIKSIQKKNEFFSAHLKQNSSNPAQPRRKKGTVSLKRSIDRRKGVRRRIRIVIMIVFVSS